MSPRFLRAICDLVVEQPAKIRTLRLCFLRIFQGICVHFEEKLNFREIVHWWCCVVFPATDFSSAVLLKLGKLVAIFLPILRSFDLLTLSTVARKATD